MRPIHTASLLALCVSACSSPRTQPTTDEAPPASSATVDTGVGAAARPSATATTPPDDGRPLAPLPRLAGPPPDAWQEALLEGTLVAAEGCLWVDPGTGSRYAVIWPAHVELEAGTSPARVIDRQSGASAQVGDAIRLGGGEAPGPNTPTLDPALPAGCRGPLWMASGIVALGG